MVMAGLPSCSDSQIMHGQDYLQWQNPWSQNRFRPRSQSPQSIEDTSGSDHTPSPMEPSTLLSYTQVLNFAVNIVCYPWDTMRHYILGELCLSPWWVIQPISLFATPWPKLRFAYWCQQYQANLMSEIIKFFCKCNYLSIETMRCFMAVEWNRTYFPDVPCM